MNKSGFWAPGLFEAGAFYLYSGFILHTEFVSAYLKFTVEGIRR